MLTKLLSLFLSFSVFFMSVAPSYAQALDSARADRLAKMSAAAPRIEQEQEKALFKAMQAELKNTAVGQKAAYESLKSFVEKLKKSETAQASDKVSVGKSQKVTNRTKIDWSSVDPDNKPAVDALYEETYEVYLQNGGYKEIGKDATQAYEEAVRTWFRSRYHDFFAQRNKDLSGDKLEAAYMQFETEAYEEAKEEYAKKVESYESYEARYRDAHKELNRDGFEKKLQNLQNELTKQQEETVTEEDKIAHLLK